MSVFMLYVKVWRYETWLILKNDVSLMHLTFELVSKGTDDNEGSGASQSEGKLQEAGVKNAETPWLSSGLTSKLEKDAFKLFYVITNRLLSCPTCMTKQFILFLQTGLIYSSSMCK